MSDPSELLFRSLAAPGLDEDDLFAALDGGPGEAALWGAGWPAAGGPAEPVWDPRTERVRRHEALLRKWEAPPGDG